MCITMWIMWISAKKRKKTQAEDVEQFVYNFGINIPEIEKSDSEFGSKKETAGYENPDGPLIFCTGFAEQNSISLKVVRR